MRGILVSTLLVAVSVFSFNTNAKLKPPALEKDYWKDVGLSADDLVTYLSDDRCYASAAEFSSCIAAVNGVLSSGEKGFVLLNSEIRDIPFVKAESSFTSGAVEIHGVDSEAAKKEAETNKRDVVAQWKQISTQRERMLASWSKVYQQTQIDHVSFENLIRKSYELAQPKMVEAVTAMAINQYMHSRFDPHTNIMPLEQMKSETSSEVDNFSGVGMNMVQLAGKVILTPMEDNPAFKAGVRHNDQLLGVNGEDISKLDLQAITDKIRGPIGTKVHLTLQRGDQKVEMDIVRAPIVVKKSYGKIIVDDKTKNKVGYIRMTDFMEANLCEKFVETAIDLKSQGAQSLVLDLRDNGGGSLAEVLCMVSSYVRAGETLLTQRDPKTNDVKVEFVNGHLSELLNASGSKPRYLPLPEELYSRFHKPLVVIVNGRSASAAELLPGSLQDYKRAVVVGEQSFGKGTIQGVLFWNDPRDPNRDQSAPAKTAGKVLIAKTIGRFQFASGRSNQVVGITPDFPVLVKPNATAAESFVLREKDMYTNAIQSQEVPHEVDTETISRVKSCVDARGDLQSEYDAETKGALAPDYQLLYAKDVATCL